MRRGRLRGSCLVRSGDPGQSNLPNRYRQPGRLSAKESQMSSQTFAGLGVSSAVADALTKRERHEPFPVQKVVIPDVLAGRDVLVKSPTGSGKTLAFGAPMMDLLEANDPRPSCPALRRPERG